MLKEPGLHFLENALSPKSSEFLGEQGLQKMAGIVITLSMSWDEAQTRKYSKNSAFN